MTVYNPARYSLAALAITLIVVCVYFKGDIVRAVSPAWEDTPAVNDGDIALDSFNKPTKNLSEIRNSAMEFSSSSLALIEQNDIATALTNAETIAQNASKLDRPQTLDLMTSIAMKTFALTILERALSSGNISLSEQKRAGVIAHSMRENPALLAMAARNEYTLAKNNIPSHSAVLRHRTLALLASDVNDSIKNLSTTCASYVPRTPYVARNPEAKKMNIEELLAHPEKITPDIQKKFESSPNYIGRAYVDTFNGFDYSNSMKRLCAFNGRVDRVMQLSER